MEQLFIAVDPGVDAAPIADALQGRLVLLVELAQCLERQPAAKAVLLNQSPGCMLERFDDPEAALAAWSKQARVALAILQRNRRRVLGLDARDVISVPGRAAEIARSWLAGQPLPAPVEVNDDEGDPQAALIELVAESVVNGNAPARRLAAELEASLAPVILRPAPQVATYYAQLKGALSALAAASARAEELQAAIGFANDNYAELAEEIDAMHRRSRVAKRDRDALLRSLEQQKIRAKSMALNLSAAQAELERKSQEIQLLGQMKYHFEVALEETHQSTSWRLTAPIRALKAALTRQETT